MPPPDIQGQLCCCWAVITLWPVLPLPGDWGSGFRVGIFFKINKSCVFKPVSYYTPMFVLSTPVTLFPDFSFKFLINYLKTALLCHYFGVGDFQMEISGELGPGQSHILLLG